MDYTEEDLVEYIKDATEKGKPDLVKYYQGHLDRVRAEKKASE